MLQEIYPSWNAFCTENRYFYPVKESCKDVTAFDIRRVYPTKQDTVKAVYEALCSNPKVLRVILFGSSITEKCTSTSDLDICIETSANCTANEKGLISDAVHVAANQNCDIIWLDDITSKERLYTEIRKGLTLYE